MDRALTCRHTASVVRDRLGAWRGLKLSPAMAHKTAAMVIAPTGHMSLVIGNLFKWTIERREGFPISVWVFLIFKFCV